MRALIDTCVISEARRPNGNSRVHQRVAELEPDNLFLSVITLAELAKGTALLPGGRRRRTLASWLLGLEQQFSEQILPVDHEVARIWGQITALATIHSPAIRSITETLVPDSPISAPPGSTDS